jgi:hypothetical protein
MRIYWPCYCTVHVYGVIHSCDSIWSYWVEASLCRFYIVCLYKYCRWRSSYQEGRVAILLTSLTLPHFYACPKPGLGFPMSYDMVPPNFEFMELRWEVVVCFVDIGEIVDYYYVNFLFKIPSYLFHNDNIGYHLSMFNTTFNNISIYQ